MLGGWEGKGLRAAESDHRDPQQGGCGRLGAEDTEWKFVLVMANLANIAEGGSGLATHCKAILKCIVSYEIFEGC